MHEIESTPPQTEALLEISATKDRMIERGIDPSQTDDNLKNAVTAILISSINLRDADKHYDTDDDNYKLFNEAWPKIVC